MTTSGTRDAVALIVAVAIAIPVATAVGGGWVATLVVVVSSGALTGVALAPRRRRGRRGAGG